MNAEEVKVGCFQMVLVLLLGINYVIVAMSHALPAFHNYTPKFYCQTKNSTSRSYGCQDVANSSIDANVTFASPEVSALASCSGEYRFVTEFAESSVVTEWGLVCEKRYLSHLGPTAYYTGVILGACIAGFLADRIGRLPVQAICLYAQGTMAVALYIVQSYPAFLALRGLQGVFVQGLQNSTYILSLELFPARSRTLVALIMQISWSIGLVLLATLSYVIPDWRILQLAVSVPTAITVLYIWIIPESPRWLLARGKSTEADMALERIAKYNSCCIRTRKEEMAEREACVKSNTTPIKPERKSRVSSADLQRARSDENQREEATNLLNGSEPEQKDRVSGAKPTGAEDRSANVELRRETRLSTQDVDNSRNLPSSSKCDRRRSEVATSRSGCDQRVSLRAAEEVVLRRAKKERASENAGKSESPSEERATSKASSMFKDSFRSSTLRKYGVIMICQWLTSAMAYGILDDLAPNIPINRYITFILGGVLEMATYTFVYVVLTRYGRRVPMCIYQSFNGVICILMAAFLILINATAPWTDLMKTIVLLLGKVIVTGTISITYLHTVETSPTVIRGSSLGLCVMFSKIGGLSMSHLLLSGQYISLPVQLVIIGILCIVSGALALILPETSGRILPDCVADVENMLDDCGKRNDCINMENDTKEDLMERQILRDKLFSEEWVDAGNGILVNFSEIKSTE
ncbi:PREDICTED: solute carrier family 22 member 6-A-like [Dinoponera quadriceps]|uniref:Solute carrier family 22 member 6-A-like n=1 Tax=Dinoponera quadriceps TaxID=609295 RepID=A0A6P3X2D1_DINQU|nr:PREDICTED: solute carrier family 22 member 6-A-like [Dinoponera quadriceps]XP_014472020.1 PREDICTED: solute carrier family 22 member 6-A-like [Dinoponera quadriceps]